MIDIYYLSREKHICQILTGFLRLSRQDGIPVTIHEKICQRDVRFPAAVAVQYRGLTLIYDVDDGYQNADGIRHLLENCDLYFKRSFSAAVNAKLFPGHQTKMFPLGFNYYVTCEGNPLNSPMSLKQFIKTLFGSKPNSYYTPEVFEPKAPQQKQTILFYTRLWQPQANLPEHYNQSLQEINEQRIQLLRLLRQRYGKQVRCGMEDTPFARQLCPDLILPRSQSRKNRYLQLLHKSTICIASTGLHGSIGWKMGEYVAAGKAIVTEKMNFTLPGDFTEGIHFLSFETPEECIAAIDLLLREPALCQAMQDANRAYYDAFVKPETMIRNTLRIADQFHK